MLVKLTFDEMNRAEDYARAIVKNKKDKGIQSKKQDWKRSDLEIAIEGVSCEMAVYKHYGIPYELKLYTGGDKIDLVMNEKNISIKKICSDVFRIPIWQKDFACDYYFAVEPLFDGLESFNLVGFISKEKFDKNCFEKTFNTPMLCVHRILLTKFEEDRNG